MGAKSFKLQCTSDAVNTRYLLLHVTVDDMTLKKSRSRLADLQVSGRVPRDALVDCMLYRRRG